MALTNEGFPKNQIVVEPGPGMNVKLCIGNSPHTFVHLNTMGKLDTLPTVESDAVFLTVFYCQHCLLHVFLEIQRQAVVDKDTNSITAASLGTVQ